MLLFKIIAMKIQLSISAKNALDELGSYIVEKRGKVEIKVFIKSLTESILFNDHRHMIRVHLFQ